MIGPWRWAPVATLVLLGCSGGSATSNDAGMDGGTATGDASRAPDVGLDATRSSDAAPDAEAPDAAPEDGAVGTCPDTSLCPTAHATVRDSAGGTPGPSLTTTPLATAILDGSGSEAPPGATIDAYLWQVTAQPDGSFTTPVPSDTNPAEATLFLPLAGDYRISLRTRASNGFVSPVPAEVTIRTSPVRTVEIVLTWSTPGDPSPTDTGLDSGSDMDLHFLREGGTWSQAPWDCFWMNVSPNWGDSASNLDDPRLDIDDVDGWGPEVISIEQPENTTFDLGVHYFNDHGFGASDPTVQVYIDGTLVHTQSRTGMLTGEFWHVATLAWPARTVTPVDTISPGIP